VFYEEGDRAVSADSSAALSAMNAREIAHFRVKPQFSILYSQKQNAHESVYMYRMILVPVRCICAIAACLGLTGLVLVHYDLVLVS
jgi:hypothetical protein